MSETFEEEFADVLASVPDEQFDEERFVPGVGPFDADVVLVGESPGEQEVAAGEPFVGQAGKQLDRILEELDVDRSQVYVTNLVKIRPPENRDPYRAEIDAWWPVLRAEFERIEPKVVVPLGSFAAKEILDTDRGITDLRGEEYEAEGRRVIPTFHPAATFYDRSKVETITEDLRRAFSS